MKIMQDSWLTPEVDKFKHNEYAKKWINLFSLIKNFRKIFKRCPICGGKILYTEYPLKKSINEKNYKKIKIFYCKHCENKEEAVKKYFNKIQKG